MKAKTIGHWPTTAAAKKRLAGTTRRIKKAQAVLPRASEDQEQIALARALDMAGLLWFHPANERKCTPAQGRRLKAKGVKVGVPDVIIITPPPEMKRTIFDVPAGERIIAVAIELKAAGAKGPTPEQTKWIYGLKKNGWEAGVCYGCADALTFLRSLGYRVPEVGGER